MRVLCITTIFPTAREPARAPFNRRQFAELAKHCDSEVLALIPWFPGAGTFARWTARKNGVVGQKPRAAELAGMARHWSVDGIPVEHPRVFYVPKVGRALSGPFFVASLIPELLARRGRFDVVLTAFGYPDGWAAVALARMFGVPSVLKVHGSDVNVLGSGPLASKVKWALSHADAVVGPGRALVQRAIELGANPALARVIPNGVDATRFRPADRSEARRALGLSTTERVVLFVGRLEPEKGVGELMEAFAALHRRMPDVRLVMVGDGVGRKQYEDRARKGDLPVTFAGMIPHADVAPWMGACDLLVLPSWAEGSPNVVIEALACGRPVVATRVGGIPDLVVSETLGELVPLRDPTALAAAIGRTLERRVAAEDVAAAANLGSWADSGRMLHEVLATVVARRAEASSLGSLIRPPIPWSVPATVCPDAREG